MDFTHFDPTNTSNWTNWLTNSAAFGGAAPIAQLLNPSAGADLASNPNVQIGAGAIAGALSPGAATVEAAGLAYKGVQDTNSANTAVAAANRDWMGNMANTAHSREVLDLQHAGLNPALAYGMNGSSTPSPPTPQIQNSLGAAVNSGQSQMQLNMTLANMAKDLQQKQANIDNTNADTQNKVDTNPNIKAQLDNIWANTSLTTQQKINATATLGLTKAQTKTEASRKTNIEQDSESTFQSRQLQQLNFPSATNEANKEDTWWGRMLHYLAPGLNAANSVNNLAKPYLKGK
jgi:hypothetical protein